MKITYILTHEDNWYFLKYLLKNNTLMRRNYLINFICTILVTPLLGLMYYGGLITNPSKLIFLFIFTEVIMILWYINYPKRQMHKL